MTTLHADVIGAGGRLALVHGFTQTRRCWGPVAEDLKQDHELILIDAPGHGRSAEVRADLAVGGRLIAERGGPATYIGYSMGGRFVLHTALECPDQVRGLVLIGATAGLESASERAERRLADEARAEHLETIGVEAFLKEWMALPLFAGLSPAAGFRQERLENSAAGLASSLRRAGTGTQEPVWARLAELNMPVLVMAGGDDHKFSQLGQRMAQKIGSNAEFEAVEAAGHTAHLEQPEQFLTQLRRWLGQHAL